MKKLMVLAAVAAMAFGAWADGTDVVPSGNVLYWMVDASKVTSAVSGYDTAFLWTVDSATGQKLTAIDEVSRIPGVTEVDANGYWTSEVKPTDISAYGSSASFLIELSQWDATANDGQGGWVFSSMSGVYSYDAIASLWGGGSNPVGQQVWSPSFNVPEPTSGLLMLLGLAGLALRRRRA